MDWCPSPKFQCKHNKDCDDVDDLARPLCDQQTKRCVRKQWCPAEDMANSISTEVETLSESSVGDFVVWFQSMVHFQKFNVDVSTADDPQPIIYPAPKATAYSIRDIMQLSGVVYNDTYRHGAVISTDIIFDCNLDSSDCKSRLDATLIDASSGYNFAKPHYYLVEDGTRTLSSSNLKFNFQNYSIR